jgi:hypothetical protein
MRATPSSRTALSWTGERHGGTDKGQSRIVTGAEKGIDDTAKVLVARGNTETHGAGRVGNFPRRRHSELGGDRSPVEAAVAYASHRLGPFSTSFLIGAASGGRLNGAPRSGAGLEACDDQSASEEEATLACLTELERRVLWLASWTIHNANHVRES